MTTSKIGVDGYISTLYPVQREIIATAVKRERAIVPIPFGLASHVISLAVQASLVKAATESRGCMGNHLLIFEPLATNRLKTILAGLPIRWRVATDGMLAAGLNLIPVAKIDRFGDAVPIRSIGFTNNVLAHLGSKRLPALKWLLDRAECRHLIANGGVLKSTEHKLEVLFGSGYHEFVTSPGSPI